MLQSILTAQQQQQAAAASSSSAAAQTDTQTETEGDTDAVMAGTDAQTEAGAETGDEGKRKLTKSKRRAEAKAKRKTKAAESGRGIRAVILVPTRELCDQVKKQTQVHCIFLFNFVFCCCFTLLFRVFHVVFVCFRNYCFSVPIPFAWRPSPVTCPAQHKYPC